MRWSDNLTEGSRPLLKVMVGAYIYWHLAEYANFFDTARVGRALAAMFWHFGVENRSLLRGGNVGSNRE